MRLPPEELFRLMVANVRDYAILDIGLPNMDGYELAERIRSFTPARRACSR